MEEFVLNFTVMNTVEISQLLIMRMRTNATNSFIFKTKITGQTNDNGIINVEIMVPLKYLSNFWRTLEMPLINCEVELILIGLQIVANTDVANQVPTFTITETNLYNAR